MDRFCPSFLVVVSHSWMKWQGRGSLPQIVLWGKEWFGMTKENGGVRIYWAALAIENSTTQTREGCGARQRDAAWRVRR